MLVLLFLCVLSVAFYYFFLLPLKFWRQNGVKQKGLFHCMYSSWFIIFKRQSVADIIQAFYDEFPKTRYSGGYQFGSPYLTIRDPELIKQITIKDFNHFGDRRTYIPEDVDPLFGKSLFSLRGERWRNMRTTISPTFTSSKMKGMFILIKECAEKFTNHFLKKDLDIISVQFKDISGRICSDVIASVAFGIPVDSLEDRNNEFFTMVSRVTDLNKFTKIMKFLGYLMAPKLYKLLNIPFADKEESAFFRNLVDGTIKEREEKGIIRPDMIHLLMQIRQGAKIEDETVPEETGFAIVEESKTEKCKVLTNITNEDITSQAFLFFFAGYESVSTLMCCMAHELAVNQDIQDKLRTEIYETNEKCSGKMTYEALVRMKYLDMVISEVLRKWPSQAGAERICTKPYTIQPSTPEESPVHLQEGHVVIFPTFPLHRDAQYFPNPERFDPERFSDENKHRIVPYSYLPFGSGPRGCIASRMALLETKIFFYCVLLKFEIVPVEKTCIPLRLVKSPSLIGVEDGCWLGLKKIQKTDL